MIQAKASTYNRMTSISKLVLTENFEVEKPVECLHLFWARLEVRLLNTLWKSVLVTMTFSLKRMRK